MTTSNPPFFDLTRISDAQLERERANTAFMLEATWPSAREHREWTEWQTTVNDEITRRKDQQ